MFAVTAIESIEPGGRRAERSARPDPRGTCIGSLELRDVELRHLEHRLHRALRAVAVRALEHLVELLRDDLPRQAEAILEPAARAGLAAAVDESVPVAVDFGLVRVAGACLAGAR